MKAAVIKRYGSPDVVKVLEVPKPTPAADEVLIRVRAATVNRTDCGELRAHPFFVRFFYGLRRPNRTIFGFEFAGEVAAVGARIRSFKPGDRVFGMCPSRSNGAHAEYVCVPERMVAAMPADARFDQAVVCEGAFYVWSSMTRSNRVVMPAPRRINGFLGFLKGRLETGQFRAIIDRTYDLAAIADAYRYVETGQKVGIVVINVAMGGSS